MTTRFLYNQFFVQPAVLDDDNFFADQTVIITGSNVGLGLEAARQVVGAGAQKVILAVRNLTAGEEARQSIATSTGRPDVCEVWELDLASYASVQAFAQRASQLPRLDAVVENAAIATEKFRLVEGHESTITVNVISTILLGLLLLPKLRESAQQHPLAPRPRLSVVVSEVHAWSSFPEQHQDRIFDALDDEGTTTMYERYPTSKLVDILALREMVTNLRDDTVVVNMVNPGFCHSQLARDASGISMLAMKTMKLFLARSTEVGARTLVAGAAAGPESHGQYMENGLVAPDSLSPFVRSDEGMRVQKRIWKEFADIAEKIHPGATQNV